MLTFVKHPVHSKVISNPGPGGGWGKESGGLRK